MAWTEEGGADPPRVAFGITRKVGPAVARNRLRRRLRELARGSGLPGGVWFVSAAPGAAEAPFDALRSWWGEAVGALTGSPP